MKRVSLLVVNAMFAAQALARPANSSSRSAVLYRTMRHATALTFPSAARPPP